MSVTTNKLIIVSTGTLLAGGAGGYILADRILKSKYEAIAQEEIDSVKETYKRLYKQEEFATPATTAMTLARERGEEIIEEQSYSGAPLDYQLVDEIADTVNELNEMGTVVPPVINIFNKTVVLENDEPDLSDRGPDEPYHISVDEFMENESDYEQATIMWYDGDGILVDERDERIDDVDSTIGIKHLSYFGRASKEAHIVYVRNERIRMDFEIVKSDERYAVAILGMDEDLLDDDGRTPRGKKKHARDD